MRIPLGSMPDCEACAGDELTPERQRHGQLGGLMRDTLYKILRVDPANPGGVSPFRLFLLRFVFAGTFLFVGINAWKGILTHRGPWDPLHGVAFSFWAAYSTLMVLGLRYPLKLVPLLLLQLFYKLVWLVTVAYPLWSSSQLRGSSASGLATIFVIAAVVDLIVIPWPYALRGYVFKGGTE